MEIDFNDPEIKEKINQTPTILDRGGAVSVKLPQCCEEARDDCPHVAQKKRDKKVNIGL